ncbi:MAG TPA: hypothetical protein VFU06_09155 [Longimicrobiales bacterium]|nr:hypothetical protein [Longimicrobiales bacterium]
MQSGTERLLPSAVMRRIEASGRPAAVVLGTNVTGLTIARALSSEGVSVIGINDPRHALTNASNAFHFVPFERFYDEALVDLLEEIATLLPQRPVLFAARDELVTLVSENGHRLHASYAFEMPAPEDVRVLMNKNLFTGVARERGWPVPETWYCESAQDVERVARDAPFPVILKPRLKNRETRRNSPRKAFICDSATVLRDKYRLLSQWEPEVIIQQWIAGTDADIRFSFHYFDSDMNELEHFEGRKIRQYPPQCGSTSCAIGAEHEEVTALSREILRTMRSIGFCSVEYKREPQTGTYYIMEPTVGRVNLQVGVAVANNVNLIAHAYCHLTGRRYEQRGARSHHVKWVLLPQDIRSARYYIHRGELNWNGYLRSISGSRVVMPFSASDLPLARALISGVPRGLLKRLRHSTGGPQVVRDGTE